MDSKTFNKLYHSRCAKNFTIQNCAKNKNTKADTTLLLEHGKPLIYAGGTKGIQLNGFNPEVVDLANVAQDDLLFHDEKSPNSQLAFLLSRMRHPDFPEPIGVFRDVDRPTYDDMINSQVDDAVSEKGAGELQKLFHSGDTWQVN